MLKVVITVILLIVLEGIKRLIVRSPHSSDYFYFNLCSCLQLFLLTGCIIVLVTRPLLKKYIKKGLLLWQSLGYLLLVLVMEAGCAYMLSHPRAIPSFLFPSFKFYYDHFDCRIIQYEPAHTRFDTVLYYSLRSNARFVHGNREYSNEFLTNSRGFRDDEASLGRPDIICLGDSYTLGWGANEQQAYPALVQQQTGLKALNAGMSSYGTARESMLLATLDTSQVKYIVWQYCANDEEENRAYLRHGRTLPRHAPQSLDSLMELHAWTRKYFPGRHFFTIAKLSANRLLQRLPLPMRMAPAPSPGDTAALQKARDFLDIVTGSAIDFSKTKIIVLDPGPYPMQDRFIRHLKDIVQEKGLTGSFLFVDCSAFLNKDDYYVLDVHLNPKGNQKVAGMLTRLIKGE